MYFSQNYATVYQDAIKSAHFGKQQITLHLIPCYYRNKDGVLTGESVVMLLDDLNYDVPAVSAFRKMLVSHLHSKEVKVSHVIECCDGSPNQYKCAGAFADIAESAQQLNIDITRCFYGSEHGKGESDGETGLVKSRLTMHVIGTGAIINIANAIKEFGDTHMQLHKVSQLKKCC